MQNYDSLALGNIAKSRYILLSAPVAQLDRVLPSEGKGRTFESSRVRQLNRGFQGFLTLPHLKMLVEC
jgi:hypothetical protein